MLFEKLLDGNKDRDEDAALQRKSTGKAGSRFSALSLWIICPSCNEEIEIRLLICVTLAREPRRVTLKRCGSISWASQRTNPLARARPRGATEVEGRIGRFLC